MRAVVTKDVPPYIIVGGVPAVSDSQIKELLVKNHQLIFGESVKYL